jgi:hypothetical protein
MIRMTLELAALITFICVVWLYALAFVAPSPV